MKKSEKVWIIILVVLLVILGISIWSGGVNKPTTSSTSTKSPCQVMCHPVQGNWVFKGQTFSSREECITECQTTIKQ
jgi:flagellar basal body-associated protein FliL